MENGNNQGYNRPGKQKKKTPGVVIFLAVCGALIVLLFLASVIGHAFNSSFGRITGTGEKDSDKLSFSSPYIAEVKIDGTIQASSSSFLGEDSYHHSWTLEKIDELKKDSLNRGIILFVNTPGGGVYESDELYFAIKDYKKATGRPVYSYMASQATSGGYYISAPCDRIYANRNCWTGSIGVTMGSFFDITELLKKHGIKSVTITAGDNKAMGSYTEKMTDEQKDILQGLVDEAYDQFVGIVAEGRNMKADEVKKLADGRVYTAKQAKDLGLIDEIGTEDAALKDMQQRFELGDAKLQEIKYEESDSFISLFMASMLDLRKTGSETELDKVKAMMDDYGKFNISYMAEIDRSKH